MKTNIKIMDIDKFLEEYLRYSNLFKVFPNKKITNSYIDNHTLDAVSYGKWLELIGYGITEETYRCSLCEGITHQKTKYCPHCGALMQPKREKEAEVLGEWGHLQGYDNIEGKLRRYDKYKCSECGCVKYEQFSICPNCGIKMKGDIR